MKIQKTERFFQGWVGLGLASEFWTQTRNQIYSLVGSMGHRLRRKSNGQGVERLIHVSD